MALFGRSRDDAATNSISFTVEPREVAPGGELVVRVDVGGDLDASARAVRVTLEGHANYQAKVTRSYGTEDDSTTSTTEEWQSYSLHKDERELPAQSGSVDVAFRLPRNVPPSSSGAVTWTVSARIDRHGKDPVARAEIVVRHGSDSVPTSRAPQQEDDGLTLDLPVAVRAGDTLSGTLTVAVGKDITARAVLVRLYRKVTYTAAPMDAGTFYGGSTLSAFPFTGKGLITSESMLAEAEVSGKRDFAGGSVDQLPFSVVVPASGGPTTAHAYARVEWRVEAVVDRRMRADYSVETPLAVR